MAKKKKVDGYFLVLTVFFICLVFFVFRYSRFRSVLGLSTTTYYVSSTGSDTNTGTSALPFKTIQKCLNMVKAGEMCEVASGIYNESLTIKNSGVATAPVTLRCATQKGCTVNSGSEKTIVTTNNVHYYIIDGFRFISTANTGNLATLYFGQGTTWSATDKTLGNNGFIVRNCYVEGNLKYYGHDNLVENCEFNGKNYWENGVQDWYATSYNNTYRNNNIYGYSNRGIWSMDRTDNIVIDGNNIHDSGKCVDADGAGTPVTRFLIKNNSFTNCDMGIELENAFDSVVEWNTFKNQNIAIHVSGTGNGPDFFTAGKLEWRDKDTHTIIRNNVMFGTLNVGITSTGQTGLTVNNNTIYYATNSTGMYSGIGIGEYYPVDAWPSNNWTVKNNIVVNKNAINMNIKTTGTKMDYNFYSPVGRFILQDKTNLATTGSSAFTYLTFLEWQQRYGLDMHSTIQDTSKPLFVNAALGNFHLDPLSPACNAGENGTYVGAFPCGTTTIPTTTVTPTPTTSDTQAPVVTISKPVNGTNISGVSKFLIKSTASDSSGIKTISIYFDSTKVKTCTRVTVCEYSKVTWNISKGSHTIKVTVTDNKGNVATKSVSVVK